MSQISNNSNLNQIQSNITTSTVKQYLTIQKNYISFPYRQLAIGYKDYSQYHYKYIYSNHIIYQLNLIFNHNKFN